MALFVNPRWYHPDRNIPTYQTRGRIIGGIIKEELARGTVYARTAMSLIHDTESVTAAERRDLIARFIAPDPHHPGVAHYQLRDAAISVWALVAYYDAVGYDLNRVADDYDIPVEQVRAALAFYVEHVDAIDAYLRSRQIA